MSEMRQIETASGDFDGRPVLPCPYCGGHDAFTAYINPAVSEDGVELSAVSCSHCLAEGPLAQGGLEAALASWNHRAGRHRGDA